MGGPPTEGKCAVPEHRNTGTPEHRNTEPSDIESRLRPESRLKAEVSATTRRAIWFQSGFKSIAS